ncbi:hypothetical protein TNCT1_12140 [Streptomyces sp. 1-11]|nr:hypothetical protein TNCT1_12140 [Streptomyces sp. 1-11]
MIRPGKVSAWAKSSVPNRASSAVVAIRVSSITASDTRDRQVCTEGRTAFGRIPARGLGGVRTRSPPGTVGRAPARAGAGTRVREAETDLCRAETQVCGAAAVGPPPCRGFALMVRRDRPGRHPAPPDVGPAGAANAPLPTLRSQRSAPNAPLPRLRSQRSAPTAPLPRSAGPRGSPPCSPAPGTVSGA